MLYFVRFWCTRGWGTGFVRGGLVWWTKTGGAISRQEFGKTCLYHTWMFLWKQTKWKNVPKMWKKYITFFAFPPPPGGLRLFEFGEKWCLMMINYIKLTHQDYFYHISAMYVPNVVYTSRISHPYDVQSGTYFSHLNLRITLKSGPPPHISK